MNGEDMFVSVEDKHFVGVGKMIFNTPNTAWNIPHLHFLVDKAAGDRREASDKPVSSQDNSASPSHQRG
jgi:hypothetical protein